MYCPSCGLLQASGLSYCKQCGAELNGKERDVTLTSARSSAFFAAAMVGTFVFGLAAIAGLIAVMKACNFNDGLINSFAAMAFLLMVILEAIFTRMLFGSARGRREAGERGQAKRPTTNELYDSQPQALPSPVMSVTEHTTRTLEPTPNDKSSR
ncbi:MAG TPA: hypothetical protein VJZ91_12750 [Blastocatellia bacterium]|nr:hypothetical protein [Blastocatellia bacterium]